MSGERNTDTARTGTDGHGLMRLEEARAVANWMTQKMRPYCSVLHTAGSIRRGRAVVHDVDIVCVPLSAAMRDVMRHELTKIAGTTVLRNGEKMVSLRLGEENHFGPCQVDVYIATPENVGMLFLVRTGSMEHNIWLAQWAKAAGMKFAAGSGIERDGRIIAGKTEEEVFKALGLAMPAPEDREIVNGRPKWMR